MHLRASMLKIFQTQAPNKLLQGSVIFLELCLYYYFGLFCLFKSTKLKTKTAKGTIDGTIELHLFKYKGFFLLEQSRVSLVHFHYKQRTIWCILRQ